jgi:putative transcriptional regulator
MLDILSAIDYILDVSRKLGNRLRVARAERDLSQGELARMAGVTRQTISALETGLYSPSALLAFTLAEQLGKRVDELFFLEGDAS